MDMDSNYLRIAAEDVEDLIKSECREEFESNKHHWFVTPRAPQGKCTLGLFKVKFIGDKMIGLCSNSYCTERFDKEEDCGEVKLSMKGANKGQFKNPMTHYEQVLTSMEKFRARNSGIRSKDQIMAAYKQYNNALTYFYSKRKVLEQGLSTVPLDI